MRRLLPTVLLTALLVPVLPAHAQGGTLVVTPAQQESDLPTRAFTRSISYRNDGSTPVDVNLTIKRLGHDLDGAPRYLESSAHEDAFALSRTTFTVRPDDTEKVRLTGSIPLGDQAIYLGVIATFFTKATTGGAVAVRNQIASQFLLRGPKPWDKAAEVTDAGLLPGQGKTVTVYADVKATGKVHIRPAASVDVMQNGKRVARVPVGRPPGQESLGPPIIIPTFTRRLVGTWTPPAGLRGDVTLIVTTNDPRATGRRTVSLDSSGSAAPVVRIDDLRAKDGAIIATLNNLGAQKVEDVALTIVVREDETVERARIVLPVAVLSPGVSAPLQWEPGLDDGEYAVIATAKLGERVLDERVVDLVIGSRAGGPESPNSTSDRSWALALLAAFLLALAMGVLFVAWRRRTTRTEEQ